ncbi:MAG TPA: bifunctional diguanylate cyclase/phosphodiesterase [Actinoplanes sp.]|nr:bifunctional diguanylate cyclase/phosphodiesterase [Actinoplanes sp.]
MIDLRARVAGAGRLLRFAGLLAALSTAWFSVNLVRPVGPPALLWLATPVGGVVLTTIYWRTSRSAALPAPTRRFWRHLSAVAVLVGVGSTAQAVDVLANPGVGGAYTSRVMLAFNGAAVLLIVYALYRLPLGRQTAGEMLRLVLDASTVMLATAVFMWHFQTRSLLDGQDRGALIASLVLTALTLVAVFAVAKVMLSGYTFIDAKGLRLLAIAMFVGAMAPVLQPFIAAIDPRLYPTMVSIPVVFFFAAWAGEQQRVAAGAPRRRGAPEERHRSFSVLPYAAVAAVDGLLIYVTWFQHTDESVIVGVVVLLTALVVLRQVTAFRDNGRLLHRLNHGATHDALTQLPNRVYFQSRLHKAVSAPGDRPVAVALIDLDDFKEVNDTLGHEVGDQLLIAVAQRLNACVRVEDTVARLGGDEFVVVLDGADPAAADLAAERMVEALRLPVVADGHELPIHASIGIADGRTGDEPSVLLRHADIAMYAAKNLPGTTFLHYRPEMVSAGTDYAYSGADLREAIDSDRLFLLYQPIVALDDGRLVGAEALVRWAHPAHGTLTPDAFIPLAERTGLIVPLGRWVLRTAVRQLAEWIAEYGDRAPAVLNVNVSARDLREPGFAGGIRALLGEYGVPADRLVLEITETTALEPGESLANLHELRRYGVRVSLDDFGTGHSTLTLLHDCPIDEIKLDRSFTQAEVDGRVPVTAAVIHLAQALGLHAVAEGVETAEQAEQLLALGYAAAQGYWFAHPMPAGTFGTLLATGRSLAPAPPAWEMSA